MATSDFNTLSRNWDSLNRAVLSDNITAKVRETVPFAKDMHLLDCGCGTGLVANASLEGAPISIRFSSPSHPVS